MYSSPTPLFILELRRTGSASRSSDTSAVPCLREVYINYTSSNK